MDRLTDRPDMTLDVYRGRKTTMQPDRTTFAGYFPVPFLPVIREKGCKKDRGNSFGTVIIKPASYVFDQGC